MRLLLVPAVLLIAACSSATKISSADKCVSLPGDSVYAGLKPVYRPCGQTLAARPLTRASGSYMPTSSSRPPACSSVELEFVVDEDGTVEGKTVHIVRTNNVEYGDAILAAVPSWRYQPATRDGKPVRQIVNEKVALVTQVIVVPKGSTPTRGTTAPPRVPTTC